MRRRTVELTRRLCRKWVALYQAHGDAGLSDKYDRYDAVFKLSVLERMWEEGLSCHDVWLGPTVVRGSSVGAERLVRKKSADEQRKERADDNWSAALSQSGSNAGGPKRKEHA